MKKRKVACLLLASVLCMSSLAGCNSSKGSSSSASSDSSKPVTLTWVMWDKDKVPYYQPLIDGYQKLHSNVTITLKDLGSTNYQTSLSTQLAGGDSGIDVVAVNTIPGYAAMTNAGELLDLTSYIKKNNINTSAYGNLIDQIKVNSKIYEVPFRNDIWVVYYNKDIFDKQGVPYPTNDMTLTQYDTLARKVTSGSGNTKVYGCYYHTWRSIVQLFGILDGKHTVLDGTYDWMKPYYNLVIKAQTDGIAMDYATAKTSSASYSGLFENNQVAMVNMGGWYLSTLEADIKSGKSKATHFGIASYPHPDGVKAGTTIGTITALAVSANSAKKDAAFDFVKYVTGVDGQKVVASTGTFPAIENSATISSIASMSGYPTDQNSKDALKTTATYLEMALNPKSAQIDTALTTAHDAIMSKSVTVDAGISQMDSAVKALLGK